MSELVPPHRIQQRPLPESSPVLEEARLRRRAFLRAMEITTQSVHTEHQREAADDDATYYLTNDEEGE